MLQRPANPPDESFHMNRLLAKGVKMTSSGPQPAAKAPQLTHFLCIPLVTHTSTSQLAGSISAFQEDVTRPKGLGGFELPVDAIRPVGTVHFTLGMMSFPKNEGLDKAIGVLQSLNLREILDGVKKPVMRGAAEEQREKTTTERTSPILITLKGLHSMQKLDKATVLYAPPVDPHGILQKFSERIRAVFKDEGLLVVEHRPLLLHATIVNTIYVKGKPEGRRGKKWDKTVICDAQAIIDRYEDQVWIEDVPLERVAICRMGAKPVLKDGEVVDAAYEEEGAVHW